MKQCIYCMKIKMRSEFNTEHVISQSFGMFRNNLTLHCVCKACNTKFGKELDEPLACDSIEAIERIRHGIKKASAFRSLGRRSTLHVRITQEGPLKGAYGHHIAGPDGESLPITLSPQLGFGYSPEGPFEWFLLDEIPSKDEMVAKGMRRGVMVRFEGTSVEESQEALVTAGYLAGTKEGDYQLNGHPEPFSQLFITPSNHHQSIPEHQIVESSAVDREPDDLLRRFAIMPGGHDEPSVTFLVRDVKGREHEGEIYGVIPQSTVVSAADRVTTAGGDELLPES